MADTDPAPTSAPGATPPADPSAPATPPPADEPLRPEGMAALREEREARKALERQIAALSPLQKLAEALGAGTPEAAGKSEVELLQERFAAHETELAKERDARWRAEVAAEKGLTAAQAARLQGTTREELSADADALVSLFPAAPAGPRTPAPDPSQGARGSSPADIDAQIAEAERAGRWRDVIALKREKFARK